MNAEPLVLVLTMGRVGSTATSMSLTKAGLDAAHIHHLNPRTLQALTKSDPAKTPPHVTRGWAVREQLEEQPDRPVRIVSLVREPVSRNLSAGFARFRKRGDAQVLANEVEDSVITGRIWQNLDTTLPGRWFDDEIRQVTGIDVYRKPFPENGYAHFKRGRFQLLVMQSAIPDTVKSKQITRLLGNDVEVGRNDSQTRDGGALHDVYGRFQQTVPWSRDDLWEMIGSRFALHFYDYGDEPAEHVEQLAHRFGIA